MYSVISRPTKPSMAVRPSTTSASGVKAEMPNGQSLPPFLGVPYSQLHATVRTRQAGCQQAVVQRQPKDTDEQHDMCTVWFYKLYKHVSINNNATSKTPARPYTHTIVTSP